MGMNTNTQSEAMMSKITKNDDGTYPAFAWPGGYPLFYLTRDAGTLCPACANRKNGSIAYEGNEGDAQWELVACDVHWEGAPMTCDHCNAQIDSAYGEAE